MNILVVDSNKQFTDSLSSNPNTQSPFINPFIAAASMDEAVEALKNKDIRISGIFVQSNFPGGGCLSVVRNIHTHRPTTPIFITYDSDTVPLSHQKLLQVGIQGEIKMPILASKMIQLVSPLQYPGKSNPLVKTSESKITETLEDRNYIPVRIDSFYTDIKSFFDVYMRLDSGKFLKILQSGQNFTEDRLNSYLTKGVQKLYITRSSIDRCISHCDLVNEILPDLEGVGYDLKICHVLTKGQFFISKLKRNTKIARREIDEVVNYTVEVHNLLHQQGITQEDQIKAIINNVTAYEHALGTTMVASLLSRQFKMETKSSIETVGMASFLHDIGLYGFPAETHSEDLSTFSKTHLELYRSHPVRGAEILEKIQGVPEIVIQAVRQHHERRDGTGFPLGKNAKNISRISEIVGLSDEFVRLLKKNNRDIKATIDEMRESIFNGFTMPMVEAFEAVFSPRVPAKATRKK